MSVHATIGDQYLPVAMAVPNQLTSSYESYVLIPHLGPLMYSKIHRRLHRVFDDFTHAISLLEAISAYRKRFGEIPPVPFVPDEVEAEAIGVAAGAKIASFEIEEAYSRPNTKTADVALRQLKRVGTARIQAAPATRRGSVDDERLASYQTVLAGFSKDNAVVSALVRDGVLFGGERVASAQLISAPIRSQVATMVNSAMRSRGSRRPLEHRELALSMTETLLRDNKVLKPYAGLLVKPVDTVIGDFLDIHEILAPADEIAIVNSCEWAFLRQERITLDLGRPVFRGPLSLTSVAPKSEWKLTQTQSRVTKSGTRTLASSQDELTQYNSIKEEVQDKLGILFDYGSNLGATMSEQGFTQDSMKNEKRSRVESALRAVSEQNSALAMTSETVSTSQISEYRTEGKDAKYATSELSFEVVSPVAVKHYLDDVSAVWAPRIPNPFAALRANLDAYFQSTYLDYIEENYVIDPMEPIPSYESVSRVAKNTSDESEPGTYTKTVTFALTESEIITGHRFGEDIALEFYQQADWYENSYDEDDRWMRIDSQDRHGGDSWVDVTISYHVDDVSGNDPDRHHITVSIDKFKETEAYRQQLNEYVQTVTKTNPARRNAVKVQARKYASLKRDELIRKYESNMGELKDYAFTSLMKSLFSAVDGNWSYYMGIIRTCIDWDKSRMDPEPCDIAGLYERVLSPYHFLNVQAVRFFLPLNPGAETIFFHTMRNVVDPAWRDLFDTVEDYINEQRASFASLPEKKRLLDSYPSELVLGRHLEAVLSATTFSDS